VWDGGHAVTTKCKVNMKTREVFDIETIEVSDSLDVLESEFVTINGVNYSVSDDDENTEYWYA